MKPSRGRTNDVLLEEWRGHCHWTSGREVENDERLQRWAGSWGSRAECVALFQINANSLRGFKAGVGMIRTEFRKNSLLICGEFEPQEELGDLLATSAVMQV